MRTSHYTESDIHISLPFRTVVPHDYFSSFLLSEVKLILNGVFIDDHISKRLYFFIMALLSGKLMLDVVK